ncbi:MAG: DUF4956 domain-containing protein [Actinomycetota bacterium]|nr:DUF4956 domain-containing protein [Actinomycetota bacterium]
MSTSQLITLDALAVVLLVFGLYFPRYRRRDMVVAILGVNVGVMAVASVLASASVSAGLGVGLLGVLSIIRLRSAEFDQEEIVYYFSAISLGLLGAIAITPKWATAALMGGILGALFVGDHPRLFASSRNQIVTLDQAYTDEAELRARLENLLGGRVQRMKVQRLDLVNDSTMVDVRYRLES